MQILKLLLLLTGCVLILLSYNNKVEWGSNQQEMGLKFGKNLEIIISDDEVIDASYLKKVLDGEIVKDIPYFDMLGDTEFTKLINYMEKNDYIIQAGNYIINQAWQFEDDVFMLNDGKKKEVLKFKKKE